MKNDQKVATEIIVQLGGVGPLRSMVGAKDFIALNTSKEDGLGPGVQFGFKGSRKANKCRITLNRDDTYNFQLFKYNRKTFECPMVYEADNVYNAGLVDTFEQKTKLRLTL